MQAFELVVPGRAWHALLSWPCLATNSHDNLATETYPVRAKRRWAVGALLFLIIRRQPSKHSDFFLRSLPKQWATRVSGVRLAATARLRSSQLQQSALQTGALLWPPLSACSGSLARPKQGTHWTRHLNVSAACNPAQCVGPVNPSAMACHTRLARPTARPTSHFHHFSEGQSDH